MIGKKYTSNTIVDSGSYIYVFDSDAWPMGYAFCFSCKIVPNRYTCAPLSKEMVWTQVWIIPDKMILNVHQSFAVFDQITLSCAV